MGYDYIERIRAPSIAEFYVRTPQGHRIVRIYLDSHNPRIEAFNEANNQRTPAVMYLQEIHELIERARILCFGD